MHDLTEPTNGSLLVILVFDPRGNQNQLKGKLSPTQGGLMHPRNWNNGGWIDVESSLTS